MSEDPKPKLAALIFYLDSDGVERVAMTVERFYFLEDKACKLDAVSEILGEGAA